MRNTSLGSSIGLVALGAILAWAVTFETEGIDINMVGVILFAVGILGIVVTLAASGISQRTVIERNREVVMPAETPHQQQQFQQPVAQQPVAQQPAAQQPVAQQSAAQQPVAQQDPVAQR